MWERTIHPTPDIKRGDISGSSLGEFRLVRDFVHVPVPFIGCRRHEDVWRISNAAGMQPYSIGGHYDRPVARRLLESAGVPRDAFACTSAPRAGTSSSIRRCSARPRAGRSRRRGAPGGSRSATGSGTRRRRHAGSSACWRSSSAVPRVGCARRRRRRGAARSRTAAARPSGACSARTSPSSSMHTRGRASGCAGRSSASASVTATPARWPERAGRRRVSRRRGR